MEMVIEMSRKVPIVVPKVVSLKKMRLRQVLNEKSVVISIKKRDCDRFLYILPRKAKFPEGFN